MKNHSILIMLHCAQNTGYAIKTLENVFFRAAMEAGYSGDKIFWSYNGVSEADRTRVINCCYENPDLKSLTQFIKANNIKQVIAFDLGYPSPVINILKTAGIKNILSYWGASMSSPNKGFKLLLKKIEFYVRRFKPDHFVFESKAMQLTAIQGRGIPRDKTSILYLGVDTELFAPRADNSQYVHHSLRIPFERKIVFYSGHMEPRKGVQVIIEAAKYLASIGRISEIHFVICGNKGNESEPYAHMLENSIAQHHVTFAGYRQDIPELMRSSDIGVIASTGWDSFTMSSVEMMASGLPLIVSNLQGLSETIEPGKNGWLIEPGNHIQLANYIDKLLSDNPLRELFSKASRQRALTHFDVNRQVSSLSKLLNV